MRGAGGDSDPIAGGAGDRLAVGVFARINRPPPR